VDDLDQAMKLIKQLHEEALKEDANVNLPQMTYLESA
jgi:hypothetical protein